MLNLVTATKAEASALIKAYSLTHVVGAFPLYKSDAAALVVSGIGKTKAAAACAWLYALTNHSDYSSTRSQSDCWLNIGIAGHEQATVGSVYTAHKIVDHGSDKVWYPPRIAPPMQSTNLTTVDKPLNDYIPDQLHDMEGSGFIETARRFAYAELVQCVKVVSDNTEQPLVNITPKLTQAIIESNLEAIINFADHLQALATKLSVPNIEIMADFVKTWQFSRSQTIKLERLLQRHSILHQPMITIPDELKTLTHSKQVIQWLTDSVEQANHTL